MSVATPPVITAAFAFAAGPSFITTPIPVSPPVDPNRASFNQGFPSSTFQTVAGGGVPPDGRDFNGLFNMLSAHTAYLQCGQPYLYNAAVPAAVTGYGAGAVIGMTDGSGLWLNFTANNAGDPESNAPGWAPLYAYGHEIISGLTGGIVMLTATNSRRAVIVLQGTLTSNLILQFPNRRGQWLMVNQCTGAFTVMVKGSSQPVGLTIPAGGYNSPVSVYSAGDDNLYPTVAPFVLPLSVAPTANSVVQRDGSGFIYATYLNQNSALEVPAVGAIFVENTVADGFLRKITINALAAQVPISLFAGQVANAQVPVGAVTQHSAVVLTNAVLTGNPTAPTAAPGDNDTSVATTAFVQTAKQKAAGGTIIGTTGAITSSFNVNGCTRTAVGDYNINITSAAFASLPNAVVTLVQSAGANVSIGEVTALSTTNLRVQILRTSNGTAIDRDFNFVVLGV